MLPWHLPVMDTKPLASTPGLLWGFTFTDGAAARVTDDTCAEALAAPHGWAWMHFALADHRARRFLDAFAPAPADARALLAGNETRLQIHLADGHAYGILPDIEKDFAGQSLGAGRIAFFLDARHLITVRHHPMRVVDAVREAVAAGTLGLAAPADAVRRLVEQFIDVVEDRLIRLTQQLDHIEDVVLSDRDDIDPTGLGPVRRELSRYHREFLGLRGALARASA
ncbi:MAG TPA: CorA family divalent cation transporter, partial [Rhizomicrobium sp.]